MRLPEALQARRFADWNYLVRGVIEVWELARLEGWEQELEALLADDEECVLIELLGRIGNDHLAMGSTWMRRRSVPGLQDAALFSRECLRAGRARAARVPAGVHESLG